MSNYRIREEEAASTNAVAATAVTRSGLKRHRAAARDFNQQQQHQGNNGSSALPPPHNGTAVFAILQYLRRLNDPKDPSAIQRMAPSILREMTQYHWLKALWDIVDNGINNDDDETCSVVADLLCHMGRAAVRDPRNAATRVEENILATGRI